MYFVWATLSGLLNALCICVQAVWVHKNSFGCVPGYTLCTFCNCVSLMEPDSRHLKMSALIMKREFSIGDLFARHIHTYVHAHNLCI